MTTTPFSFPQWVDLNWTRWRPMFVDYLYLSFTNCTAFSPTDTMPVKPSVKQLRHDHADRDQGGEALEHHHAISVLG